MIDTILIDENIPFLADIIKQKYKVQTIVGRKLTKQHLLDTNCSALFVRSTTIVDKDLLVGTAVKFIATATSGSDHIDKEYLAASGIRFADALGSNSNSVAEYVVFAILHSLMLRNQQVNNRSIGIVGYGNIGSKLAYYANQLGFKVFVNDPPLCDNNFQFPDYCTYLDLDELIAASDIISNHVPLDNSSKYKTVDLFNSNNLAKCKSDAIFVHCSRGRVVNEETLSELIINNPEMQLVIDVFADEPHINEYLSGRAVIATPHIAGYSRNGKLNGVMMVLDAFEKFTGESFDKSIITDEYRATTFRNEFISEDFIYQKIEEYRKIVSDSATFKHIISLNKSERMQEFDRQRKEYPARFEYLKI